MEARIAATCEADAEAPGQTEAPPPSGRARLRPGGSTIPVRITRVYTRTGDGGETALVGGRRIPKDAPRIAAYGTLDELNAAIGLARVFNAENLARGRAHRWLDGVLRRLQDELFDLGSELATPLDAV